MRGFERKKRRRERGGGLREGRGEGGAQGGPREPQGGPREAPERPQGGPGGPARPQELPRDPSIVQEMKFIENHMNSFDFHRFQVAGAQDDASIEALKGFGKWRIPLFFQWFLCFDRILIDFYLPKKMASEGPKC